MGFNCGIVGLPNVGKSTIFNAMTKAGAQASNYPFTTIEPNIGVVPVRDERLMRIAAIVEPKKITPTAVEFVDIAGLVKGASAGEGLGNQFLGHIRSVDTIAHIVRCFEDPSVVHVSGTIDPSDDIEIINTELILADINSVEKRLSRVEKTAKSGDKAMLLELEALNAAKAHLEADLPARTLSAEIKDAVRELNLLTAKPVIYVANVGEDDLMGSSSMAKAAGDVAGKEGAGFVVLCGKVEVEVAEFPEGEREGFLRSMGLEESGLDKLVKKAYELLGLITFFTAGKKEVRAWTIRKGAKAPQAGSVIHTDFERGFIRAEVISYEDFIRHRGEGACREKGLMRLEGKDYVVRDGDMMNFRFSV